MGNQLQNIPEEDVKFLSENTIFKQSEIRDFYRDFMVSISNERNNTLNMLTMLTSEILMKIIKVC